MNLFFAAQGTAESDGAVWGIDPFGLNALDNGVRELLHPSDPRASALIAGAVYGQGRTAGSKAFAMTGDEIDIRMLVQMAAYTIHSDATPLEGPADGKQVLTRIVVPGETKRALLERLAFLGVKRSSLFPDLENLAQELAETFFFP
jgi:hypothetical protein